MSGRPPLALDQTSQGPGGRGAALEITTCDCQGEEIQEDRNNQIRHHLKWNIHSDGSKDKSSTDLCRNDSLNKIQVMKRQMHRLTQTFAVFGFNCCRMWIGNEVTTGYLPNCFTLFTMLCVCEREG